jgi:predicted ArsR family transcriptional regulator
MKLGEIRNYIKQRGESSLTDVATRFDISKEAAKLAIEYWVKKGKIEKQGAACGSSCNGCGDADENYQWVKTEKVIRWL